jgi:hypothetical protein
MEKEMRRMKLLVALAILVISLTGCATEGEGGVSCLLQCQGTIFRTENNQEICHYGLVRSPMCDDWRVFHSECQPEE